MGRDTLPKGQRLRALATALHLELGEGSTLTLREASQIIMPTMDVWTRPSIYHVLDAMDLAGFIRYDRDRIKDVDAPSVTILSVPDYFADLETEAVAA